MDDPTVPPNGDGVPPPAEIGRRLNIKVVDQEAQLHFLIKGNTKLGKVMTKFCESSGKHIDTLRFWLNGERTRADQTPDQVSRTVSISFEDSNKFVTA